MKSANSKALEKSGAFTFSLYEWVRHYEVERSALVRHTFNKAEVRMSGVQYITDGRPKKTCVVLDLKVHSALWEDMVSRSRKKEKSTPLAKIKASLIAS